jgi:hypothetical protein
MNYRTEKQGKMHEAGPLLEGAVCAAERLKRRLFSTVYNLKEIKL